MARALASVRGVSLGAEGLLALDAEVGGEDLARRGRRRLGAESAALDRDGDHDPGIVVGRHHDVPGLVALRAALGGAGLPRDLDREAAENRLRRAARIVRGGP